MTLSRSVFFLLTALWAASVYGVAGLWAALGLLGLLAAAALAVHALDRAQTRPRPSTRIHPVP